MQKHRCVFCFLPDMFPQAPCPCSGPTPWRWGSLWSADSVHCGWTWHPTQRRWSLRRRSGYLDPPVPRTLEKKQRIHCSHVTVITNIQSLLWAMIVNSNTRRDVPQLHIAAYVWCVCHRVQRLSCHRGAGCPCCCCTQTSGSGEGGTLLLLSPPSDPPCWLVWCPQCLRRGTIKEQKPDGCTQCCDIHYYVCREEL